MTSDLNRSLPAGMGLLNKYTPLHVNAPLHVYRRLQGGGGGGGGGGGKKMPRVKLTDSFHLVFSLSGRQAGSHSKPVLYFYTSEKHVPNKKGT